ncbi:BCL2 modifying factor 2 [Hoplias malabaricus]|uniref:BCL2 modifying factor 2 n=1 Tax=Hoplias malabaricus TaxID=27720 RepID=UPI0034618CB3
MEDEDEDLALLSHRCERTHENRETPSREPQSDNSTLNSGGGGGRMPLVQTVPRCRASGSRTASSCGTASALQRTVGLGLVSSPSTPAEDTTSLLRSLIFFPEGEPEFPPHFPAREEEHGQQEPIEEEAHDIRMERRAEEGEEVMSVEVQIGQKLREIGDQFQRDHLETFLQYERGHFPAWWRFASALYRLLFPREAIDRRGAQR